VGRRTVDTETLAAVRADLRIATDALKSAAANLATNGISKVAEDEEPPAETGGDIGGDDLGGDDLGGDDLGDDFDEGTTGEEGGDLGDGDLGDLGGDMGGGFGGGGGGLGGGLGEDVAPEGVDADAGDTAEVKAEVDGLRTELDAVKRTIVDISENLRQIRNPLGDPASGNDAMQSV